MPRTFLTASWRKLIMAQYEVDPAILTPWLPSDVELDLYQGKCYVSLVGFLFDAARVFRCAVPFHTRFPEVNLRFYVVRTEADGTRKRGVMFVSEFVPRAAISLIANNLYQEPYTIKPMCHSIDATRDALEVSYGCAIAISGRVWRSRLHPSQSRSRRVALRSSSPSITGDIPNALVGGPQSTR